MSDSEYESVLTVNSLNTENLFSNKELKKYKTSPNILGERLLTIRSLDIVEREKKDISDTTNELDIEINKNWYSLDELRLMSMRDLYNILNHSYLILFIDNKKLDNRSSYMLRVIPRCNHIKFWNYREILFLPFEYKYELLEKLNRFNRYLVLKKKIRESEKSNIIFEEGIIEKDILYRRLKVQDNYLYIPVDKYQMKLTEYKIRGFCQIMEELGAYQIDIEFHQENEKKSEREINMETKMIAGNLGFSVNSNNNEENRSVYSLRYPDNNNIILNKSEIESKIRKGEYLISLGDYSSNLELQYVINSRCRHYISDYSTTFRLKRLDESDNKLVMSLGLKELIGNISINNKKSDILLISTIVKFDNSYREPSKLLNVSLSNDELGFNYIMNNIKRKYDRMNREWLVYLWGLIDRYIKVNYSLYSEKNVYSMDDDESENYKYYSVVRKNMEMIKEYFSLDEIVNILDKYFNIDSQMNDFLNFIKIIANKSRSYDSLGLFILLSSNKSSLLIEKVRLLKIFINSLDRDNILLQEMLILYNDESDYNFYEKINDYGIFILGNWSGMKKLIYDSSKYKILEENEYDLTKVDDRKRYYDDILNNYMIGYKEYIFSRYILKFIENQLYYYYRLKEYEYDMEIIKWILESINRESFDFNIITNYQKLEQYLINRRNQINRFLEMRDILRKYNSREEVIEKIIEIINEDGYFTKKFNLVFYNYTSKEDLWELLDDYLIESGILDIINNFLLRIFSYNYRLNILEITLDEIGFLKVRKNIICGLKSNEIENMLIYLKRYGYFNNIVLKEDNEILEILRGIDYKDISLIYMIELVSKKN